MSSGLAVLGKYFHVPSAVASSPSPLPPALAVKSFPVPFSR
ncbi:hypothetical protein [Chryseobacterium sp.]|nr:hypothetical protein [Chryseobacterium sp.]